MLFKIILLISSLSVFNNSIAAPALNNITINDSLSEVIIDGNNFGESPNVVYFENFEGNNKFESLLKNSNSKWLPKRITIKEQDGNNELRLRDPTTLLGQKGAQQLIVNFQNIYTEAFIALSVKIPKGSTFAGASTPRTFPNVSSWKFTWLMLGANGFQTSDFDICLPTHVGNGGFLLGGNNGNLTWIESGNKWWEWDNFNHISSYIKISKTNPTVDPIEYFWSVTNNIVNIPPKMKTVPPSNFNSNNLAFDRINIPGWFGNGNNDLFDGRYDNIYVAVGDNALARVVITDSPVFEKSKFAIPVMAKSWTNNKIILDTDVLPTKTVYVHVIDKLGTMSTTSLELGCKKCPKPPTPL